MRLAAASSERGTKETSLTSAPSFFKTSTASSRDFAICSCAGESTSWKCLRYPIFKPLTPSSIFTVKSGTAAFADAGSR